MSGWPQSIVSFAEKLISKQPSLGRVAAVAFYDDGDRKQPHMHCYTHKLSPPFGDK